MLLYVTVRQGTIVSIKVPHNNVVYPILPVSLDCPFLIVPSIFSNVYLYYTFHQEGDLRPYDKLNHETVFKMSLSRETICVGHQAQITLIRHEPSYKQLEVKTNRALFFTSLMVSNLPS
jgi:hypothetical protein